MRKRGRRNYLFARIIKILEMPLIPNLSLTHVYFSSNSTSQLTTYNKEFPRPTSSRGKKIWTLVRYSHEKPDFGDQT